MNFLTVTAHRVRLKYMSQPVNGLYRNCRRGAAAYLVLLLALVPTGIVYFQVRAYEAARDRARFDEVVRLTQEKIEERITHHADELLGLRGLFAADRKVEWAEWESYVASLELPRRYPGLRAFGYAQRVDHADRAGFVSQMRQSIAPDFEIFPAGNREFYFPMIYMNPFEDGAKKNLGWDGYSEPARRAAMDEAGETGKSIASSRVQMMAGDGTNLIHGFVIFSPIFKSGAPVKSGPERRAALQGFVSSAFLPEKLLDGSFPRSRRATRISRPHVPSLA